MKITIRKAKRDDWLRLAKLHREFNRFHFEIIDRISRKFRVFEPRFSQRNFFELLRKRNKRCLVALADEEIIGFVLAEVERKKYQKNKFLEGVIHKLYLTKECRGKGVAKKLKRQIYQWFDERGVKFIELCVYSDNRKAIDVYKNWGFKPFVLVMESEF